MQQHLQTMTCIDLNVHQVQPYMYVQFEIFVTNIIMFYIC